MIAGGARAGQWAVAGLIALAAAAAAAGRDAADVFNYTLSPELAGWMVGAPERMATDEEIREFVSLSDDAAARAFIERFWAARDPDPRRAGNPVRDTVESRAAEADRRFTEAGRPGRGSDRGTTYILYGEPDKIDFQPGRTEREGVLEVWHYPGDAPRGLDGRRPDRTIRFSLAGEVTKFYVPGHPSARTRDHL